jgi:hypothetical protein
LLPRADSLFRLETIRQPAKDCHLYYY